MAATWTLRSVAKQLGLCGPGAIGKLAAGHHSDCTNATRVPVVGVVAFGLAYVGFTHDTANWLVLLPWFVLDGIGIGRVGTAQHAAVTTHAPAEIRCSAFGLLAATKSFGNLAASLVAGILWTAVSPSWAFFYLPVAMAVALVTLVTRAD